MHQGLAAWRAMGIEAGQPYWLAMLAETYGRTGQAEAGMRVLAEALALVDTTEERWWEGDLHRLKGELLLALSAENQKRSLTARASLSSSSMVIVFCCLCQRCQLPLHRADAVNGCLPL